MLALLLIAGLAGNARVSEAVTAPQQINRLLQVYSALLDYRAGQAPVVGEWGKLEVGLEVLPMPTIDTRVGAKTEPVHPPPAIPRPRAQFGLGAGFTVGALFVPPVPVAGYSALLTGVELQYGLRLGPVSFGARTFTLQGELDGPFSDPSATDVYSLQNTGADARLGFTMQEWTVYGGGGSGHSRTRLEIKSDGSINSYQFDYSYVFGGLTWQRDRWRVSFEQEQTEGYLDHVVLTALLAF